MQVQERSTGTRPPAAVPPIAVLDGAERVGAVLPRLRRQILGELQAEPDSAAGLARRIGLPRQKINYHLRELERHGLVELAEERRRRGFVERALRPTARAFWVDPDCLGTAASAPGHDEGRFSAAYLISLAARAVRDVVALVRRAAGSGKRLPTLSLETEVRLASPRQLARFQERLAEVVAETVEAFHDGGAASGRPYRVVLCSYPKPNAHQPEEEK